MSDVENNGPPSVTMYIAYCIQLEISSCSLTRCTDNAPPGQVPPRHSCHPPQGEKREGNYPGGENDGRRIVREGNSP